MGKKLTGKVAAVKKLESGKIAVKWEGTRKYVMIEDDIIAQFIIFRMTRPDNQTQTSNYPLPTNR